MADSRRTLSGYIDEVASGKPTPGGGSVAAIVGALAAALGEMVINLSLGRDPHADVDKKLETTGRRLATLRDVLYASAATDELAYARYRAASSLPRGSVDEKATRLAAMQAALIEATDAPLAVARAATGTAEVLESVANLGNPHLRPDAALGALLAEAALRGALLNVRGNAAMLRDKAQATGILAEAERLEQCGRAAAERAFRVATQAG